GRARSLIAPIVEIRRAIAARSAAGAVAFAPGAAGLAVEMRAGIGAPPPGPPSRAAFIRRVTALTRPRTSRNTPRTMKAMSLNRVTITQIKTLNSFIAYRVGGWRQGRRRRARGGSISVRRTKRRRNASRSARNQSGPLCARSRSAGRSAIVAAALRRFPAAHVRERRAHVGVGDDVLHLIIVHDAQAPRAQRLGHRGRHQRLGLDQLGAHLLYARLHLLFQRHRAGAPALRLR